MSALPFDGLSVIITGDADGLTRDQANAAIARLGGKPVSSVSGKTGLVIIGEGAGVSKMAKTRQHKLNVIDGPAFLDLIAAVDDDLWDGHPVGEPVADYEARTDPQPEPEPDPQAHIPFAQRHLIGRASHFPKVDGKIVGHYRFLCQCGHKWVDRLGTEADGCPAHAGATLFTGPWEDLDLSAVAPVARDWTKPPLPAGATGTRPRPAPAVEPKAAGDVPEDPFDSFDPYDSIDPPAASAAHPGGDW